MGHGLSERQKVVYVVGSLRNPEIPAVSEALRKVGFDVYDDWWSASEDADDWLHEYYRNRGFTHKQILSSYASKHIFELDLKHLNRADIGVLVMPAGRSGHLELGYLIGQGKPSYVLFAGEPKDRYDQMHQFASLSGGDVVYSIGELLISIIKNK
jgi:hypothetical protein